MRTHARLIVGLAAAFVLVAACGSGGGAGVAAEPTEAPVQAESPVPTPAPTMQVITAPPATPKVMTDGEGDEHVTGVITNAVLSTPYTRTSVDRTDGVTEEVRGGIAAFTFDMNDERVGGVGHFAFSLDIYGYVGSEWGTLELTTDTGAWNGPCSGGVWAEGEGLVMSCWLAGSGGYDGWTYYVAFTGPSNGDENGNGIVEGIVYRGVPPTQ